MNTIVGVVVVVVVKGRGNITKKKTKQKYPLMCMQALVKNVGKRKV